MPDISIVIPTYNPDLRVFERCLNAVYNLNMDNIQVECLIIDNNSSPALSTINIVQAFLKKAPWSRVIVEKKQGSGNARICGFDNSQSPIVITFDDDNEPHIDYLQNAIQYLNQNPETGMFGPGIVKVQFIDGAKKSIENFRWVYQELYLEEAISGNSKQGNHAYFPYGTGLVVRKEVVQIYLDAINDGTITAEGRVGSVLTSCEDMQMVWLGVKHGYTAARTPLLKLNHLINGKKSNFKYLKKLTYGGALSYLPARYQVFPEEKKNVLDTGKEVRKSMLRLCKVFVYNFYKPRFLVISLISQLGILQSIYQVNNKKPIAIINWLVKVLKVAS